jgi:imidazolonepropionase-like amidohydrolase
VRNRLVLLLLVLTAGPVAAQERIAIKGGRVLPVSGAPIDGATVLIHQGKIEAVGKDVPIPADAKVIDATGKWVIPGLVDVHSTRGMDQTNETNPNVPFLSVVDAIDPSQDYFEECRRQGITTVLIAPGNNTMFGGQAAILKTGGTFVDQMIVKRSVGIKISLKPVGDRNRMGHVAAIRKELDAARDALADKTKAADAKPATGEKTGSESPPPEPRGDSDTQQRRPRPTGGQPATGGESVDAALVREALGKMLKGDMMAFIHCEVAMDVPQALKLMNEYKLKAVLVLDRDCYKAVKHLAAAKVPVVLDSTLVFWETDPRTGEEKQIALPKLFREAGVPVAYQVAGAASAGGFRGAGSLPPAMGNNYLWYQAATAVKYGTPPDEALRAITLRAAQTLGIGGSAGSLEPGKDADVVILTGDPLKLDTWVETTIAGGKIVYERDKDRKLKALLEPEK